MKRNAESGATGSSSTPSSYPQGIETLLRKAASDVMFREQLLEQQAGAAKAIGLELEPAEQAMLESIPSAQILLTIEAMDATKGRRRGFLVKLAIATVVAGAAAGGVWIWRRREPSYKGKGLSEWLRLGEQFGRKYGLWSSSSGMLVQNFVGSIAPQPEMAEVEEAIHAMGINAIPPMLAMLETRDPAWKLKLMGWLRKQSAIKIQFTKAETYQKRALIGLTVLGPLATKAVPVIQKAMTETNKLSDSVFQAYAKEALEKIAGTNSLR